MELGSVGSDAEDEFAEAVDAMGGSFEGLGGGIVRWASDDHLNRMVGEEGGSQAVGGGEEAVLRAMPAKASNVFGRRRGSDRRR